MTIDDRGVREARVGAYVDVVRAGTTMTLAMQDTTRTQTPAQALAEVALTAEVARFVAPQQIREALLAVVAAAQRCIKVFEANGPGSQAVQETAATFATRMAEVHTLMRADLGIDEAE